MATVSKELYDRLIENRPLKLSEEEVSFRAPHDVEEKCSGCIHFFKRALDGFTTCEIFRPANDSSVDPAGVCDFFSVDGETFPLLD